MGYGAKKKRYLVVMYAFNYRIDEIESLRIELFDTLDQAIEFKTKAESSSEVIYNYKMSIAFKLYEIKSTNANSALERFKAEFPKSNLSEAMH